jgi:hypothetical protein
MEEGRGAEGQRGRGQEVETQIFASLRQGGRGQKGQRAEMTCGYPNLLSVFFVACS